MTAPEPSVGRIVHYVSHGTPIREDGTQAYTAKCRAAVVTATRRNGECVSLCVLNPTGLFFHEHICQDEAAPADGRRTGTWHWPERTEETPR